MQTFLSRRRVAGALSASLAVALTACGGGGGSSPEASSAPTTAVASTIDVPIPVSTSADAPAAPTPAALMDLSGWKLNLPIDANGGTGGADGVQYTARTVLPQELAAGFTDEFFQVDAQGRILFTAPANGAVTTPGVGSDHTRSELREFHRNGDAKGDWTGSGALSATCEVQQVASASKNAVIGQLRSETHVFAQMLYRVATQDVAVDVYQSDIDGSRHAATVLLPAFAPGQPIAYTMSLAGGVLTASANGVSRQFTVDSTWTSAPLYFKVGAYHGAPNVGNPAGDKTVVACSRIAITH
jgi:hypothetical protein